MWHVLADEAGEFVADRIVDGIRAACERIAVFPGSGSSRSDFDPDLRSFVVKNYIFFYHPYGDGTEIVRILHSARDIESLLEPPNA